MSETLRMAEEAAQAAGSKQILKLRLRLGLLSGVDEHAMRFAFEVVGKGTMAQDASLEIELVPTAWWCETCRAEFECADVFNECPRCHNPSGELRRGRELEIASVELE